MRQQQKKEASPLSLMRCLVDDTILTRNIQEIETWVSQGLVVLVVPLYSTILAPTLLYPPDL